MKRELRLFAIVLIISFIVAGLLLWCAYTLIKLHNGN